MQLDQGNSMRQSWSLNLCSLTPESTPCGTAAAPASEVKRTEVGGGRGGNTSWGQEQREIKTRQKWEPQNRIGFNTLCAFYAFIYSLLISKMGLK